MVYYGKYIYDSYGIFIKLHDGEKNEKIFVDENNTKQDDDSSYIYYQRNFA